MSRMPEDHIHRLAAHGFQAGAQTYVKGRPDYPSEVIAWLRDQLGLQNGRTVLDLGAGTGKFLPRLLATDAHVIAVEPVEAMRAALSGAFPQVEVRAGRAEAIPLESGSVDAVTCAQAFHWFATRPALAEIHRVLKSDGALGLIWNVRDESVEWVRALTGIIQPFEGDAPRYQSLEWRAVFPAEGFSELKEFSVAHAHVGPPEQVIVDRTLSISFVAALPVVEQDRIADEIRALIARTPELAGKSTVSFPYRTHAYCCRKIV